MISLILFLIFNSISRVILFFFSLAEKEIEFSLSNIFNTLSLGIVNDSIAACYFLAPIYFIRMLFSNRIYDKTIIRFIKYSFYFILIVAFSFQIIAEFTFWIEFSTRFNFIAVDYLIYTTEVIGNIKESYPIFIIIPALFIFSLYLFYRLFPLFENFHNMDKKKKGQKTSFAILLISSLLSFQFYNPKITDIKDNNFLSELNKNGLYNLFSAFLNNSIEYDKFYLTKDSKEGIDGLSKIISNSNQIERFIKAKEKPNNYNVILVTIESLSSSFINSKYNNAELTPNMNKLIDQGIYFSNYFATGTRTVRGLEAITLAIPPIPGQSILRRKNNEKLFSIASVLKKENYDIKFIYGGYGYFDNMNYFFSNNNFKTIDRQNINKKEIKFENVWGISDEDLYEEIIKQADKSFAEEKKFFSLAMTTSNHRPYTYPEGRIDIASKSSREGGVKYTDFALGDFLRKASQKPWFDKTIFVITADHCAGSAGKVALPLEKYHIPLLIYAPNIFKPQKITKLASQIDLAPTILGLLNISYQSKFLGNDLFTKSYENAFISTFQKLGYISNNKLTVLSPGKLVQTYDILEKNTLKEVETDEKLKSQAIDYYQSAYYLFSKDLLKEKNEK